MPGGFSPPHPAQARARARPPVVTSFSSLFLHTLSQTLVQTIARGVLEVIVDQSPLGPEETLEEQKPQAGEGEPSEEETPENEVVWRQTVSRKKTGKNFLRQSFFYTKFSSDGHFLVYVLESC